MDQKTERRLRELCDSIGRYRLKCHRLLDKIKDEEKKKKEEAEARRRS